MVVVIVLEFSVVYWRVVLTLGRSLALILLQNFCWKHKLIINRKLASLRCVHLLLRQERILVFLIRNLFLSFFLRNNQLYFAFLRFFIENIASMFLYWVKFTMFLIVRKLKVIFYFASLGWTHSEDAGSCYQLFFVFHLIFFVYLKNYCLKNNGNSFYSQLLRFFNININPNLVYLVYWVHPQWRNFSCIKSLFKIINEFFEFWYLNFFKIV